MRPTHGGKPGCAVVRTRRACYLGGMNTPVRPPRLPRFLRLLAVATSVAGAGIWLATGAHLGWTQTSAVTLQRDEITGIDYPVRRAAFIAGVEVPAAGFAAGMALATAAWVLRRRTAAAS